MGQTDAGAGVCVMMGWQEQAPARSSSIQTPDPCKSDYAKALDSRDRGIIKATFWKDALRSGESDEQNEDMGVWFQDDRFREA